MGRVGRPERAAAGLTAAIPLPCLPWAVLTVNRRRLPRCPCAAANPFPCLALGRVDRRHSLALPRAKNGRRPQWAALTGRQSIPLPYAAAAIPLPRAKLTAAVYPAALPISALPFHSLPRAASYRIDRRRYAALAQGKERPAGKGSRVDRRPRCCLALPIPLPCAAAAIPCPGQQSYRIDRRRPAAVNPAALRCPGQSYRISRPQWAAELPGLTAAAKNPILKLP